LYVILNYICEKIYHMKPIKLLTIISFLLFSTIQMAQTSISNEVTLGYVMDNGNFFTPEEEIKLTDWISDYQKKTSIEIAVVTVTNLNGVAIEDAASSMFNKLGIGKSGADNGILLMFSMEDRKSRIEVGNGMEEFITDIEASDMLYNIKPFFKEGNYAQGVFGALSTIKSILGEGAFANKVKWLNQQKALEQQKSDSEHAKFISITSIVLLIGSIFSFIGLLIFLYKKRQELIAQIDKDIQTLKAYKSMVSKPKMKSSKMEAVYTNLIKYIDGIEYSKFDKISSKKSKLEAVSATLGAVKSIHSDYNSVIRDCNNSVDQLNNLHRLYSDYQDINTTAKNNYEFVIDKGYIASVPKIDDVSGELQACFTSNLIVDKVTIEDKMLEYNDLITKFKSYTNAHSKVITFYDNLIVAINFVSHTNEIDSTYKSIVALARYERNGEIAKAADSIASYKKRRAEYNEYIGLSALKTTLYNELYSLLATLKNRKRSLEDIASAAAASAYQSSYSSNSGLLCLSITIMYFRFAYIFQSKTGGKMMHAHPYYKSSRAVQDPTHKFPPICEESYFYWNKEWRDINKLGHYLGNCDFHVDHIHYTFQDGVWATKNEETRNFAIKHYFNVVADMFVRMIKK